MSAAFPPMHGDPLLSRPVSAWDARDWDEVAHLSELAADKERAESDDAYVARIAAALGLPIPTQRSTT